MRRRRKTFRSRAPVRQQLRVFGGKRFYDHVAEAVNGRRRAHGDERRRRILRDDARRAQGGERSQILAAVDDRLARAFVEVHARDSRGRDDATVRRRAPRSLVLQLLDEARGAQARAHDFNHARRLRVAVARLVLAVEARDESAAPAPLYLKLERLTEVARRDRPRVTLSRFGEALAAQSLARLALHRAEGALNLVRPSALSDFEHERAARALDNVRAQAARRRQSARLARHDDARDAQRARKLDRVQAARAAERDERARARVEAALDRDRSKRTLHPRVHNAYDAERRLDRRHLAPRRRTYLAREFGQCFDSTALIKLKVAAEQVTAAEPS